MIEESATVIAIDGSNLTVRAEPSSACGQCKAQNACGQGLLSKYFSQNPGQLTIENRLETGEALSLLVGDKVIIGIQEGSVLSGAFFAYLLPLVFVVIFAGIAQVSGIKAEWQQVVVVATGLFLGIALVKFLINDRRSYLKDILPVLLRSEEGARRISVFQESDPEK